MMQLSLCVNGIKHCVLQELQSSIKNYIMSCKGLFSVYEKLLLTPLVLFPELF